MVGESCQSIAQGLIDGIAGASMREHRHFHVCFVIRIFDSGSIPVCLRWALEFGVQKYSHDPQVAADRLAQLPGLQVGGAAARRCYSTGFLNFRMMA